MGPWSTILLHLLEVRLTSAGVEVGPRHALAKAMLGWSIPTLRVRWQDVTSVELIYFVWSGLGWLAGFSVRGGDSEPFAVWAGVKKVRRILAVAAANGVDGASTPVPLLSSRFYRQSANWRR